MDGGTLSELFSAGSFESCLKQQSYKEWTIQKKIWMAMLICITLLCIWQFYLFGKYLYAGLAILSGIAMLGVISDRNIIDGTLWCEFLSTTMR